MSRKSVTSIRQARGSRKCCLEKASVSSKPNPASWELQRERCPRRCQAQAGATWGTPTSSASLPRTMWEPRPCSSTTQRPAPLVWGKHQTWDEVGNLQGGGRRRGSVQRPRVATRERGESPSGLILVCSAGHCTSDV